MVPSLNTGCTLKLIWFSVGPWPGAILTMHDTNSRLRLKSAMTPIISINIDIVRLEPTKWTK